MLRNIPRISFACLLVLFGFTNLSHAKRLAPATQQANTSGAGYRFDRGGWMFVHLEGTAAEIGFQHGQLLSAEIADLLNVMKLETKHDTKRDWNFYRDRTQNVLAPHRP